MWEDEAREEDGRVIIELRNRGRKALNKNKSFLDKEMSLKRVLYIKKKAKSTFGCFYL